MNISGLSIHPVVLVGPLALLLIFWEVLHPEIRKQASDKGWLARLNAGINRMLAKSSVADEVITNINCGIFAHSWRIMIYLALMPLYDFCFDNLAPWAIPLNVYTFLAGFVLFDFIYYIMHWCSHRYAFLWIGHSVHHQSTLFNFSVGLRQGLLAPVLTFPFYMLMAVAGFDLTSFLVISGVNAALQFLGHTEYCHNLGILDKLFMTPRNHRVHHSANTKDSGKNLGGVLLIWDHCFGTLAKPDVVVERYGLHQPFHSKSAWYANWYPVMDFFNLEDFRGLKGDTHTHKPAANPWLQYYCLLQFFGLFTFALYFLFNHEVYGLWEKLIFLGVISMGIYTIGLILAQRKFAFPTDLLRLGLSVGLLSLLG